MTEPTAHTQSDADHLGGWVPPAGEQESAHFHEWSWTGDVFQPVHCDRDDCAWCHEENV